MKENYPTIKLVDFMEFWRWEYVRRNRLWKDKFFIQLQENNMEEIHGDMFYIIDIGDYKDAILNIDDRLYLNTDDIIADMINGLFCYKKPYCDAGNERFNGWRRYYLHMCDNEYGESEDFDSFQLKCNREFEDIKTKLAVDYDNGDRIIIFNLKDNASLLLSYIDKERTYAHELAKAIEEKYINPVRCANVATHSHYEKFREIQIKEKKHV